MDLGTLFRFAVERAADAEAVVDGAHRRSYGQWYGEIRAVAGGLQAMGLQAGDHLVVVMRNRYETATLYWAAHMLGAIFTPVTWRATAEELRYCLEDAEAAVVAFDDGPGANIAEALAALDFPRDRCIVCAGGQGEGLSFASLTGADPVAGPVGADPDLPCLMLYTSGTTGTPFGRPVVPEV